VRGRIGFDWPIPFFSGLSQARGSMDQAIAKNQHLPDRLIAALRQDEFILYRQLIAPLAPKESERPFQEILIRFQEEEAKLLPPGSFYSILEEGGLMSYVDRWVVNRIVRWVHSALTIKPDWLAPHNGINLSAATLSDRNFAEYTRKHLQAAALPAGILSFEITCDSAVLHVEPLLDLMAQLRPAGCGFILARFDGGEGAFELLRRLAPEFVKLSPGLVRILNQGRTGLDQIDAINRECHALGIKTIAEHVESDWTIAQLRGLGVDFGQGFGIQAPQPLA
jgi:EAL domain-containing protein (putative c-di-GMP-specific phosphodiesterase class I)